MAFVQLNQRLGALLASLPSFDMKERRKHLGLLRDKYGLTMRLTDGYQLTKTYTDGSHDTVKVQFDSIPSVYAILKIEDLRNKTARTDIYQSDVSIKQSDTSQTELETWIRDVFQLYSPSDNTKRLAGYKAVDGFVKSGMLVGLGTGSTAFFAVQRVGQKLQLGLLQNITCIPTSERTRQQAESLNIPLCTLNNFQYVTRKEKIDVAIDGADAVDPYFTLIKGGGGALLREKMVETVSNQFICIVDDTKLHTGLGPSFALPVEIVQFGHEHTMRVLHTITGGKAVLRRGDVTNNRQEPDEEPAVTENGNYIVDLNFESRAYIHEPFRVAADLKQVVGVVEHGLFCNMANYVIVAQSNGECRIAGDGEEQQWWNTWE